VTSVFSPQIASLGLSLGLLFALVCYLVTNLSPGGMITPAWLALTLVEDWHRVALIGGVVLATWGGTLLVRRFVILYGKRLFASVVMLGVFLQMTVYLVLVHQFPLLFGHEALGFIVPGLIAYQLIRQPVLATTVATAAVTAATYAVVVSGLLLRLVP
jgi:gamma-polyglutamate biosynthesis protein CapC